MPAVPTAQFSTSGVGSGTFAWVGSVTDANGEIAATFKTAAGGVYAIAISFNGAVVGVADIFAGSSGSGSVSAFTDISRDAANTAGGTLVTLTVADATGTPTVLFGGASATDVTVVNATTITCRTPATSAGSRALVANLPAMRGFENVAITPVPETPYVTEEYLPGGGNQLTYGGSGATLEVRPTYVLTVYAPQDTGVGALRKTCDALLTHFAPTTPFTVNGDVLRVRHDVIPSPSPIAQTEDGWATCTLSIPLALLTTNSR
jgi:hypothetical protein